MGCRIDIQCLFFLHIALVQARAAQDVCLGTAVRPVLLVPGFLGSPLYDSERSYDIEWPDFDAIGKQYSYDPAPSDLDLPMVWDGLEQAQTSVGPERRQEDEHPSLNGFVGNIFELMVCFIVTKDAHSTADEKSLRIMP